MLGQRYFISAEHAMSTHLCIEVAVPTVGVPPISYLRSVDDNANTRGSWQTTIQCSEIALVINFMELNGYQWGEYICQGLHPSPEYISAPSCMKKFLAVFITCKLETLKSKL